MAATVATPTNRSREHGPEVARLFVALALVGSLGCEYLKEKPSSPPPTNIRCESVSPPAPDIPEDRRKRLDEIADLNSYIDLEVARRDKELIESNKEMLEGARKSLREADGLSSAERGKRFKWVMDSTNTFDEVLDAAAKRRHR